MKQFESKYFKRHKWIVGGQITVAGEDQRVHVSLFAFKGVWMYKVTFLYISELRNVFLICSKSSLRPGNAQLRLG